MRGISTTYRLLCEEEGCRTNSALVRLFCELDTAHATSVGGIATAYPPVLDLSHRNYLGDRGCAVLFRMLTMLQWVCGVNMRGAGVGTHAMTTLCAVLAQRETAHESCTVCSQQQQPADTKVACTHCSRDIAMPVLTSLRWIDLRENVLGVDSVQQLMRVLRWRYALSNRRETSAMCCAVRVSIDSDYLPAAMKREWTTLRAQIRVTVDDKDRSNPTNDGVGDNRSADGRAVEASDVHVLHRLPVNRHFYRALGDVGDDDSRDGVEWTEYDNIDESERVYLHRGIVDGQQNAAKNDDDDDDDDNGDNNNDTEKKRKDDAEDSSDGVMRFVQQLNDHMEAYLVVSCAWGSWARSRHAHLDSNNSPCTKHDGVILADENHADLNTHCRVGKHNTAHDDADDEDAAGEEPNDGTDHDTVEDDRWMRVGARAVAQLCIDVGPDILPWLVPSGYAADRHPATTPNATFMSSPTSLLQCLLSICARTAPPHSAPAVRCEVHRPRNSVHSMCGDRLHAAMCRASVGSVLRGLDAHPLLYNEMVARDGITRCTAEYVAQLRRWFDADGEANAGGRLDDDSRHDANPESPCDASSSSHSGSGRDADQRVKGTDNALFDTMRNHCVAQDGGIMTLYQRLAAELATRCISDTMFVSTVEATIKSMRRLLVNVMFDGETSVTPFSLAAAPVATATTTEARVNKTGMLTDSDSSLHAAAGFSSVSEPDCNPVPHPYVYNCGSLQEKRRVWGLWCAQLAYFVHNTPQHSAHWRANYTTHRVDTHTRADTIPIGHRDGKCEAGVLATHRHTALPQSQCLCAKPYQQCWLRRNKTTTNARPDEQAVNKACEPFSSVSYTTPHTSSPHTSPAWVADVVPRPCAACCSVALRVVRQLLCRRYTRLRWSFTCATIATLPTWLRLFLIDQTLAQAMPSGSVYTPALYDAPSSFTQLRQGGHVSRQTDEMAEVACMDVVDCIAKLGGRRERVESVVRGFAEWYRLRALECSGVCCGDASA